MAKSVSGSGSGAGFGAASDSITKDIDSCSAGVENFFKKLGTTLKRTTFQGVGWLLTKIGNALTKISKAFTNDKTFLTDAGKSVSSAGKKLTQKAQPPLTERATNAANNLAQKATAFGKETLENLDSMADRGYQKINNFFT